MTDGVSGETESDHRSVFLPADLAAVVVLVVLADLIVLVPVLNDSPLRIVLSLPLVLVLPGYAVVAALFPERGGPADPPAGTASQQETEGSRGIDRIERAALSVALSIPVVALTGLGLSLTPLGVRLAPILVAINVVTLGATAVAARRRARLPEAERFRVPYRTWLATGREWVFNPPSRTALVLNAILVASVLLAVGSVTYAVAAPNQGEAFTEFYLLTENETGDLVADDYPTEFTVGETRPIVVGIENHEHERVEYTVVAHLQRVRIDGNETIVLDTERLDRFSVTLADNETWQGERTIEPSMTGERLRVVYLLYRGSSPADPSVDTAYRSVHLWITVGPAETDDAA